MQPLLYTLLLALVALSLGEGFNAQFMMQVLKPKPSSMAEVQKAVIAKGKPGVVFVTQSWCGACDFLKSNLNESSLKDRMNEFVVVAIEGDDGVNFQKGDNKDEYVPRVYFLNADGTFYDKGSAPNPDYEFFFPAAHSVMQVLDQLKEDNDSKAVAPEL